MKSHIIYSLILAQLLASAGCSAAPGSRPRLTTLDRKTLSSTELDASIEQVMEKAEVAGLSLAIINKSQIVYQKAFGYKNKIDGTFNDDQTLFSAASFSKTVFAYLVMVLVEEKVIDLDRPLYEYLTKPLVEYPAYADLKGDDRYKLITARMVLSHSTGFPNLRFLLPDGKLKFLFSPGERHSYSGEGINLLQMVVEEITGKELETLAQQKVFQPLGMTRSSYLWQPEFEENYASPHDIYGRPRGMDIHPTAAGAGGSMVTTAGDYARFLTGFLNAKGQRRVTVDEMLQPQVAINYRQMFGPDAWKITDEYRNIDLSWSLGWGRFDSPYGRAFFHTGHGPGWQNYTVTYPDQGIGIVMLSNSDNFESVAQEIAQIAIGDSYSPYEWLGYVPFDPLATKKTPPPDPVAIQVDPAILSAYAGAYDLQPTAVIHIKYENDSLFIQTLDGQSWNQLLAETETSFFVKGEEETRITFIKDSAGKVTAIQLVYLGIPMPPAKKERSDDMNAHTKSEQIVDSLLDVGGYRLHFRVYAGTFPAVLLESGGGADASWWETLAPVIARETGSTIITYDRAGYGDSDLPDTPYDIRQEVAGLWRGLEQLGLDQSLILLGHSYGGMLIMVSACEHPDAVRGLVFLDGLNVEFIDAIGGADGLNNHPLTKQFSIDRAHPEKLSKPERAFLRIEAAMHDVVATMHTLSIPAHIPVRVITAGIPWWPKPEENQAWRESHEHLAASVKDGKLLVAEHSAHLVDQDQPEIIVAAIAELIRAGN